MEDYALGSLKNEADKKTETGEGPAFEYIKEMMDAGLFSSDSKSDLPWLVLMFLLVFGAQKPCGGSEYWRGKYEELKEIYDMRIGHTDWKLDLGLGDKKDGK